MYTTMNKISAGMVLALSIAYVYPQIKQTGKGKISGNGKVVSPVGEAPASPTFSVQITNALDTVAQGVYYPLGSGDTYIFGSWGTAGSFTFNGAARGGSVYGTLDDGNSVPCDANGTPNGNLHWIRLVNLDMVNFAKTRVQPVNCMTSFRGNGEFTWAPAASGTCTNGINNQCNWKSFGNITIDGVTYLQVHRQSISSFVSYDSTLIKTTDGGVHWTNPAHVADGRKDVNGDAPAGPGDPTYPASIMWPDGPAHNGASSKMGRVMFIQYCQNGTVNCPNVDNNSRFVYAISFDGGWTGFYLARVVRANMPSLNAADWSYYVCPGYSTSNVCDGSNNANWSSDITSATKLYTASGMLGGIFYSPDIGGYVKFGQDGNNHTNVSWARHVWGPWQLVGQQTLDGYNFSHPILPAVRVIDPGHIIEVTISGTGYQHSGAGTLYFTNYRITCGTTGARRTVFEPSPKLCSQDR